MKSTHITHCPSCKKSLLATRLSCPSCKIELTGTFPLSPFLQLSEEEQKLLLLFLQYEGNITSLIEQLGCSRAAIKKKIQILKKQLGLSSVSSQEPIDVILKELPVYHNDSTVVQKIKTRLNAQKGSVEITLPRGNRFTIYYDEYGNGLIATNLPKNRVLTWEAFDKAIELLKKRGGRAEKGNAMKARLGEPALSLHSVEGYVAAHAYGVKKGESTLRTISTLSAILEWAGLCKNGYGYLELDVDEDCSY